MHLGEKIKVQEIYRPFLPFAICPGEKDERAQKHQKK
jgi:hypothetical protein